MGRQRPAHLEARPIDIDILLIDDLVHDFGRFEVPHPYLAARPYNLVPLAEIAGEVDRAALRQDDPRARGGARYERDREEDALAALPSRTARKKRRIFAWGSAAPASPAIKRMIRLDIDGRETAFNGVFSMVADLAPDKAGVHMSRFSELLEEATLDVLSRNERPGRIEDVVAQVAREIVDSQKALRADVRLRAEFGLERWTPVSGKRGEETYTLIGIAHADREGVRRVVGVEAEGMTACPCAQLMVREHSIHELMEAGFSESGRDARASTRCRWRRTISAAAAPS